MKQQGFTLLELSIVLVIIGLIVGGITVGSSMIRAAELRSVMTEMQRYETAVNTFKDKYFHLPGDMPNAIGFWGGAANCPGAYNQGTTDGTTCNGDGNGNITNPGGSYGNETFRFWQHLANAGLVEGSYDGVTNSTAAYFLGVDAGNSPQSKSGQALWVPTSVTSSSSIFSYPNVDYEYIFGGQNGESWNSIAVLTAAEAWNIDKKLDDAKPGRGVVRGSVGGTCSDAANNTDYDADYELDESAIGCTMIFDPR